MINPVKMTAVFCVSVLLSSPLFAGEPPWGRAAEVASEYSAQKVVYDLFEGGDAIISVLDRASFISILNDADPFDHKIVVVIHGDAIPYFAVDRYADHVELMNRAQSLSVGDIVEFRLCGAAARLRGLETRDFHGFVKVIPMADAEIVKLQHEGFAYMQ